MKDTDRTNLVGAERGTVVSRIRGSRLLAACVICGVGTFALATRTGLSVGSPPERSPRASQRPPDDGSRAQRRRAERGPERERAEEPTHFEQDDAAVTWSGPWSANRLSAHSGGSAKLSMETSSEVSLAFRGRGVSWLGYRDEWSGIADVLIDGRLRASVDTYSNPARAQAALYSIDDLQEGRHTLTIRPTGRRQPASGGAWIWIDGFSIKP